MIQGNVVRDLRKLARASMEETTKTGRVDLSEAEARHIFHLRAIGHGEARISVMNGQPARVVSSEVSVDYTKEMKFDPPG